MTLTQIFPGRTDPDAPAESETEPPEIRFAADHEPDATAQADDPRGQRIRRPARAAIPRLRLRLAQLASLAGLVAVWWSVTTFGHVNPVVLPSPGAVAQQLVDTNRCIDNTATGGRVECGVQGYYLWQHLLATLERIAVGLSTGTAVGVIVGALLASSRRARTIVEPYLSFLRALPPLGYIGLLIVWFGLGNVSMVALLFLASFPTVTVSTLHGISGIPKDWLGGAASLGASPLQRFTRVIVPGTLPDLITGIRLAAGLSWAAIVAAEMNDGIPGIGGLAYVSGTQLDTALTVASIIVIGLAALVLDQLLLAVERRLAPWRGAASR